MASRTKVVATRDHAGGLPAKEAARQSVSAADGFEVVAASDIPLRELFHPWELVDWTAVNGHIRNGDVVHIPRLSQYGGEHWDRCARMQLGMQNVDVFVVAHELWIVPKGTLRGVLIEGDGFIESDD